MTMRVVYFGSGAFGVPTLRRLADEHELVLVVTQPDRPAGRNRQLTPTPVAVFAEQHGVPILKPEDPNARATVDAVAAARPEALVVIAYGHKLGPALIEGRFAINLHASLLPKYRGAAPINWAMIRGERETGVSVITLAQQMDAGRILAQRRLPIDPRETAGELHDRLAELGPGLISCVLAEAEQGSLEGFAQDPALVTQAPKLSKADGAIDFNQPADAIRARIHGLTPWPGCAIRIDGQRLKILRVQVVEEGPSPLAAGQLTPEGLVGCHPGTLRLLEVQPPGRTVMTFEDFRRGHALSAATRCEPA